MPDAHRALIVTGIYTLTPTHCGTGQAAGAVDLPIAREAHTRLPILPATTLKGVARDWFDPDNIELYQTVVKPLFGPRPPKGRRDKGGSPADDDAERKSETEQSLSAGDLVFLDGLLLAFPVRSLTLGFRLVTAPLLLQRLQRIAHSFGASLDRAFACPDPPQDGLLLPSKQTGPVSLEDLVFSENDCRTDPAVDALAEALARLVARDEKDADRRALARRLVVVPDAVLQDITQRATTVTARIVLNENKTSNNLWYEETLPPDCLFAAIVGRRPGSNDDPIQKLVHNLPAPERHTQIGGNATVGCGIGRWVLAPTPEVLT